MTSVYRMEKLTALLSGVVFGLGLILSGMVNPAIVLSFLDVTGDWNSSLLWVMVSAVAVGSIAFALAKKRRTSFLELSIELPTSAVIDRRLLLGSFLFGVGWGMAGICPGPALVLAGTGNVDIWVFLLAMLLGMGMYTVLQE